MLERPAVAPPGRPTRRRRGAEQHRHDLARLAPRHRRSPVPPRRESPSPVERGSWPSPRARLHGALVTNTHQKVGKTKTRTPGTKTVTQAKQPAAPGSGPPHPGVLDPRLDDGSAPAPVTGADRRLPALRSPRHCAPASLP